MKKHFLLALLALFPLFALAGSVTSVTLTKAEGSTADAPITFGELVSVTTSQLEYTWYGWVEPSDFTYKAYKLVNGQFSAEPSYSGDGSAPAPTSDGVYQITVSRPYYQSYGYQQEAGTVVPFNPGVGTWEADKLYTVTTPAQTNPSGGIDVNEIVGNLQVNALSQKKYWGQLDPEPRFNITNGWNRIISPEAINLDPSTISMFRNDGEDPGQYAWNVNVVDAVYNYPGVTLISGTGDFLIIKKVPVNETSLFDIAPIPDQTYTGSPIEPGVKITYHRAEKFGGDLVLTAGTDYTLVYEDNIEPGRATVKITGTGTYFENTTTTTFKIVAAEPDEIIVSANPNTFEYNGAEHTPETVAVKVILNKGKENEKEVTLNESQYTYSFDNVDKVSAGTKEFPVSLQNGYTGTGTGTYAITPTSIESLDITVASAGAYTSQEKRPAVTVKFNGEPVNANQYEVTYANNKDAGDKAEAIITAVEGGSFAGSKTVNFTITKRNLKDTNDPTLKALTWTGAKQEATITGWGFYGSQIPALLKEGLTVTYKYIISDDEKEDVEAIVNAGAYEVTFTAADDEPNFTDSKTVTIEVAKASFTAKVKDVTAGFDTDWTEKYEVVPAADLDDDTKAAILAAVERGGKERFSLDRPVTGIGEYTISYNAGMLESEELDPNFNLTVEPGTLTITKATLKLIVNAATINYGEAVPNFTFAVESGLPEGETFRVRNLSATPIFVIAGEKDSRGLYPVKRDTEDKVTSYEVSVEQTDLVYDENYNVIVKPGTLTVNPLEIPNSGFLNYFRWTLDAENLPYNGKPQVPEMTVTYNVSSVGQITLDPEKEYDVTATNNRNASTATNPAVVRITGKGNFTGYREANFYITRVPLTVKAVETTVAYNELATTVFAYEVEGLMPDAENVTEEYPQDDIDNLLGASGKVVVNNTSTTTVGRHPEALVPTGLGNPRNYNVTYVAADLIVTAPEAKVSLAKTSYEKVYGEADPEFGWTYETGNGLMADEEAAWQSLITGTPVYKVVDADGNEVDYKNVGTYNVIVEGLTATNYTVKSNVATLTVNPRPITVTPVEQSLAYGSTDIDELAFDITITEGAAITGNALAYDDTKADLGIKVVLDENATAIGENKNALTIDDTEANDNYEITVAKYDNDNEGAPIFFEAGEFVLHRVNKADFDTEKNDAAQLIKDYDGVTVETVIINHNDAPTNSKFLMIGDKWYAFVLPFKTSPRELNKKFGYAVVNVLDQTNDKKNKIAFKLNMVDDIPANTPFVVKIDGKDDEGNVIEGGIDLNSITFSNKKIEYKENPEVEDASGVKFIGSYTGKIGFKANEYFFSTSTREETWNNYFNGSDVNTTYMRPLGSYLWTEDAPGSAARIIVLEEEDGTLTTIRPVGAETVVYSAEGWYTLDGMKLNAAPTEKGIYINNGKKVVIK